MNSEMSGKWLSLQSDLDDLVHPSENAIAKNVFLAHCKEQSPMPTCSKWLNPKMFPETYWAAGYEHQSFQFYQLVQVDVRAGVHSVKDVLEFWFAAWNLDSVIHSLIVRKYIKYLYQKKKSSQFQYAASAFFYRRAGETQPQNCRSFGRTVQHAGHLSKDMVWCCMANPSSFFRISLKRQEMHAFEELGIYVVYIITYCI